MSDCKHEKAIEIGSTVVDGADVYIDWCPDCGALKRTMIDCEKADRCIDWPWRIPGEGPFPELEEDDDE